MDLEAPLPGGPRAIEWDDLDKKKFYAIGPTLFLGMRLILYPPAMIKTRLQVQRKKSVYKGTFDAFRQVIRHEGFRALYKGFLVNTIGLVAGQAYVTTYELTRKHSLQYVGETWRNFVAGAAASSVAQSIIVPVDVVSQLLMMQGQTTGETGKPKPKLLSTTAVVKDLYRAEGVRGLYRGMFASLATFVPNNAVWWMCYGILTKHVSEAAPSGTPVQAIQAVCGGTSGLAAVVVTNPLDVVRTRLQVEGGKSMISTASTLWAEEGYAFLYKGVTARILASVPSSMIIIICYETVKRLSLRSDYKQR